MNPIEVIKDLSSRCERLGYLDVSKADLEKLGKRIKAYNSISKVELDRVIYAYFNEED